MEEAKSNEWRGKVGKMTEEEISAWDKLWADVQATRVLALKVPPAMPNK